MKMKIMTSGFSWPYLQHPQYIQRLFLGWVSLIGRETLAYFSALLLIIFGVIWLFIHDQAGLGRYLPDMHEIKVGNISGTMREQFCQPSATLRDAQPFVLRECLVFADTSVLLISKAKEKLGVALPVMTSQEAMLELTESNHSAKLKTRYREIDGLMSDIIKSDINWGVISEGFSPVYASNNSLGFFSTIFSYFSIDDDSQEISKYRNDVASSQLEQAEQAVRGKVQFQKRFDRAALSEAFNKYDKLYQSALDKSDHDGAVSALWQLSRLLDGVGQSRAALSVDALLSVDRLHNRATQANLLVRDGAWIWLGWGLWLFLTVQLGRRADRVSWWAGLSLLLAMGVAAAEQRFLGIAMPDFFYWTLGSASVTALAWSRFQASQMQAGKAKHVEVYRQAAHWALLPGWLLFVGLGWLIIADISLHFHDSLRFLLVDQHMALWWAFIMLGIFPLFRPAIIRLLVWVNSHLDKPTFGGRFSGLFLALFIPVLAYVLHSLLGVHQYLTGDPLKGIAILYAAWFLLIRANAIKTISFSVRPLLRLFSPSLLAFFSLSLALFFTQDFGPLMILLICILLYWCGAYFGIWTSLSILVVGVVALFNAGSLLPEVIRNRINSAIDPFSSANDDMARLIGFQQETPFFGFGLGNAPWCGYSNLERCAGLPTQLQSDYTFTALMGLFGVGSWLVVFLVAGWFLLLMWAHLGAPSTTLALLRSHLHLQDGFRAWLAIVFGTLMLTQLGVTVAGNMAWLPLTGVTLPWISFGTTALLLQTLFFALLIDVDRSQPGK